MLRDFYYYVLKNRFSCGGFWALKTIKEKKRFYFSFFPSCKKEIFVAEVSDSGIFFSDYFFEVARKIALKDFEKDFFILDEIGPLEFTKRGHWTLIEDIKKSYKGILVASSRPSLAAEAANLIGAQKIFDEPSKEEIFLWMVLR